MLFLLVNFSFILQINRSLLGFIEIHIQNFRNFKGVVIQIFTMKFRAEDYSSNFFKLLLVFLIYSLHTPLHFLFQAL